jgi:DNA-directed RNA polymerase sigma subunit (sigma70/sigma32)
MSDFAVRISVRNARLLRAMKAAGYKTQTELCRAMGRHITHVNALFTFRTSPILEDGEWSELAMDISSMLRLEPEELWPAELARFRMKKNSREVLMSADEVRSIAAPCKMEVDRMALNKLIGTLAPRHKSVIEARFGLVDGAEATLEDIAKEQGVTRERIRQHEMKAIRTMKREAVRKRMMPAETLGRYQLMLLEKGK